MGLKPAASRSAYFGQAKVQLYDSRKDMGIAAANDAAKRIAEAITARGHARVMLATGNSQLDVSTALVKHPAIDWAHVDIFHMDEYVGLPANHPASFRKWIKEKVVNRVIPASAAYINGDAPDLQTEQNRYANLLHHAPMDVAFVGFGENGHIAFNDPALADFNDPQAVKLVDLDLECRTQQVNEGHFSSLELVPKQALSITCSELIRARSWISCVPESRKAKTVLRALTGPISTDCPASIVRTLPDATVYLDPESAALLWHD